MTMRGLAFLPIWHDVDDEADLEFNRWHTVEHMPERLARRHRRRSALCESGFQPAALLHAVRSDVVRGVRVRRVFRDCERTLRMDQTRASALPELPPFSVSPGDDAGPRTGGALATVRVIFKADAERTTEAIGPKDRFTLAVRPLVERAMAIDLVTSVHAGVTAPVARKPLSAQSLSLRPNATAFNGVLMVEAIGRDALHAAMPGIEAVLQVELSDFAGWEIDEYDLAYVITSTEG